MYYFKFYDNFIVLPAFTWTVARALHQYIVNIVRVGQVGQVKLSSGTVRAYEQRHAFSFRVPLLLMYSYK